MAEYLMNSTRRHPARKRLTHGSSKIMSPEPKGTPLRIPNPSWISTCSTKLLLVCTETAVPIQSQFRMPRYTLNVRSTSTQGIRQAVQKHSPNEFMLHEVCSSNPLALITLHTAP